ncbi:hypothetical protein [Streptococcus sobrinus]|uniref:hypothetical protein n=1 Tax=Streptococcus sobrinus TaxID=1310 RepID=UPI00030A7B2F|nr:hypothetical protein [Streptococcus sobrinus]
MKRYKYEGMTWDEFVELTSEKDSETKITTVYIDTEELKKLDSYARQHNYNRSQLMRKVIKAFNNYPDEILAILSKHEEE